MISVSDLQAVAIFRELSPEDLARLAPSLTERTFAPGATIIYRGDPGYSLFAILEGSVSITLRNDEGIEYVINTQGEGENFGEMALITGEPRSANVKADAAVRLAELSQEAFFALIDRYPALADTFLQQIAQRRARTMVREQFAHLERAEIIANLFAQKAPDIERLIGKSKWTADTNTLLQRVAGTTSNVLITGSRGTGKDLTARLVHFHSPEKDRPLFHLDCSNPPPIQRQQEPGSAAGQDVLHLEIAQESALFGHGIDAGSYAKGIRRGYLELADGGAVVLENVEALSPHVQRLLVQYLREGSFVRTGETSPIASRVRLICTALRPVQELKGPAGLDPELVPLLATELLALKPLRERKKDIPELAAHLLTQYNRKFGKEVTGFSEEALNSLVDHDWPLNVDEMHQVLERAVAIADGATITERHIFVNVHTFSTTGKFNLLKIPSLRELANHQLVPRAMRLITVPFILALTVLTLLGPDRENPANLLVWGVWWPFLIFSVLVSARSWCAYCPLPPIGEGISRFRKRFQAVPEPLARHGVWIGIVGFALILLWEHAAHMFTAAHATGVLLTTILTGAAVTNLLLGKRSWCKHICPLGRMVAQSSTLSVVGLGTNTNVCSSQCQSPDCIKDKNCAMGIHPSAAGLSKDCVLCLSCVKKCRNHSVRIEARLPWQETLSREKFTTPEASFALLLTALVLALKLPASGPFRSLLSGLGAVPHALAELVAICVVVALFIAAVILSCDPGDAASRKDVFTACGPAYLFLAFAGLFNIYFRELVESGANLVPWILQWTGAGGWIPASWVTPELGTLKYLIPCITLAGMATSLYAIRRLSEKHALSPWVRRRNQGIMLLTGLAFLALL
ncbi:MAG TPA: sigma 54-interacting transcriptional regulator [Geobacteraceae bacterium]|nr:sigma 54-interacting transcriptional regulator [Geobacteraceae bacterium]